MHSSKDTNIESKINFFLSRELNWEATKDRVNKRALRVIEKRKAKKRLDEEIQDDRRYLAHQINHTNRDIKYPQDI